MNSHRGLKLQFWRMSKVLLYRHLGQNTRVFPLFLVTVFYRFKAALVLPFVNKTVISELQMEPWAPSGLNNLSYQEAQKSFFIGTV